MGDGGFPHLDMLESKEALCDVYSNPIIFPCSSILCFQSTQIYLPTDYISNHSYLYDKSWYDSFYNLDYYFISIHPSKTIITPATSMNSPDILRIGKYYVYFEMS